MSSFTRRLQIRAMKKATPKTEWPHPWPRVTRALRFGKVSATTVRTAKGVVPIKKPRKSRAKVAA